MEPLGTLAPSLLEAVERVSTFADDSNECRDSVPDHDLSRGLIPSSSATLAGRVPAVLPLCREGWYSCLASSLEGIEEGPVSRPRLRVLMVLVVLAVLGDQSLVKGLDEAALAGAGLAAVAREAEGMLEACAPRFGTPPA